ncbi:MAG: polysaccharide deacetylase family protein [Ferruginibacter sp.]|nr:polysaccharide deacetylase family protein [Ferruginibacter sp.]
MDSDPGGNFSSSAIFKTTVLTVAFTSFYFFKTQKTTFLFKAPALKHDPVVVKKNTPPPVKKKKRTIYLTFDDGPNKGTKNVINIVKKEDIPVTLFVIGEHVYGSQLQLAMYDSATACNLFEIANHSYTHAFENRYREFYELPDSVVNDFSRCADSLHIRSGIIRTPGRNIWRTDSLHCTDIKSSTEAADSLYENGFKAIGWDLEWHFNNEQRLVQTTDEMLAEIDSAFAKNYTKTCDHLVLLAHDQVYIRPEDSASLHNFIIQLKKRDIYNFEQVSKYPGVQQ